MNIFEICTNFIFKDNIFISLITVPIEFINIVLINLFISLFYSLEKDINLKRKDIIFLGLLYCTVGVFFKIPITDFICVIGLFIVLKLNLKDDKIKSKMIFFISVIIGTLIIQSIFSRTIYSFNSINKFISKLVLIGLSDIILINIYLVIKKSGFSTNNFNNINKKYLMKVAVISFSVILAIYIQVLEVGNMHLKNSIEFGILNTITIILFFYVMLNNISKTKEIKQANIYIDNLEVYNKNLTEMNDSIRGFKHDFNNIVQAINGYIMLEDIISLKKYFSRLLVECNQIKNLENLTPDTIKNPAIYSILVNKYNLAKEKNIKITLEVVFDFQKISEYSYDISRILGILLDNAIEASVEAEEKRINIRFNTNKNIKCIEIENTYKNDENIDTSKIFEKNFTTKKECGNTGIGLWEVKKILDKNKMLELYTNKSNKLFKQSLEIYEKPIV